MPTILTKKSDTPGAVPSGTDLTNLAGGAEVAVNTADKRMFTMNSSSAIIELGTNPGSLTTAEASATVFRSGSATITNLIATTGTVSDLSATVARVESGTVTTLVSTSATITNLTATSATISNFTFTSATVTRLAATSATISDLSATVGRIGSGTITNLLATSLTVSSGSTLNGGVVINELGADADTRIEGNTDANLFFVDASTDRIGVGTNAPSNKLTVSGNADITGTLGIGTSSPAYKLDVAESGAPTSTNAFSVARISGSDSVANDLTLLGPNTSQVRIKFGDSEDATIGEVGYNHSTNSLRFVTNGAEVGVFDSSGNLGLGLTPNNAYTPGKALQIVSGGATIFGANTIATFAQNINISVTGSTTYQANGFAAQYTQTSGQHQFFTAPSGTAGNAITFTQAMTLTATGRLGVGVTSPTSFIHAKDPAAADTTYRFEPSTNSYKSTLYVSSASSGDGGIRYDSNANQTGLISYSDLIFYVGNGNIGGTVTNERARITSGGELLVGTTSVIGVGALCNFYGGGNVLHIRSTNASANNFVSYNSAGSATATLSNGGALTISGALSKGSGSFRIDHPLKPDTHQLVHSFIEGPQADLIYRGKVALVDGQATVNIDTASGMTEGTFVALCRDVQCFTSNESDWDAVRGSVSGNILTIECQNPNSTATISWMVIGERQDKHMYDTDWTDENGKVIVEPEKPEAK